MSIDPLVYADIQRRLGQTQGLKVAGNPTQTPQAAEGMYSDALSQGLYNPQTMAQLQSMFSPYFNQQKSELYQTLKNEQGFLGQSAGANAAAQGLANPGAYSASAQSRLSSAWAPSFSQLQTGQMGQVLNATGAQSQFNLQGLGNIWNMRQQQQQLDQQPSIWQYILGGLIGAGGQLGAAAIGASGAPKTPKG